MVSTSDHTAGEHESYGSKSYIDMRFDNLRDQLEGYQRDLDRRLTNLDAAREALERITMSHVTRSDFDALRDVLDSRRMWSIGIAIGMLATMLTVMTGAALWIGNLQAMTVANAAWIQGRTLENLPPRMATVEARQQDVRVRLDAMESAFHKHELEDNKALEALARQHDQYFRPPPKGAQ